ncbi:MAG: DMT family transporter [Candidatus Bipolaricaulia bacterium]
MAIPESAGLHPQARAVRLSLLALTFGIVGIAFSPIFVRLSLIGPIATGFYRFALALPLLALWMRQENRSRAAAAPSKTPREYARLMLAGVFIGLDLSLWHWAIVSTSVANATLFANFASLFVTIGAWLFFGDRITRLFLIGLSLALLGASGMMLDDVSLGASHIVGNLLALGAAVFYAGYLLSVKSLRAQFSTATVMTWSAVGAGGAMLVLALLTESQFVATSLTGWLVLAGLAWISHAGGQGLIAFSFRQLPASFSSVSLLLQPVLAALFAWVLLSEPLSLGQGVSGLVVLVGIMIARRGSRFV